jgi:hypothetical protein
MGTIASCRLAGGRGADAKRPLLPLALARWTWAAQKKQHGWWLPCDHSLHTW